MRCCINYIFWYNFFVHWKLKHSIFLMASVLKCCHSLCQDTLNKCLYKWSRRPVGSCHAGPAAIPVSEKRHVCVSLPHGKSTPRVLQLNLHKAATLGSRQLAPLWRYWLVNRGSTKINMIFITLFWNELATGTALLVPNFLEKAP